MKQLDSQQCGRRDIEGRARELPMRQLGDESTI